MERSKCELCGEAMVTKKATMAEPYRYQMSGLDNVFLAGIDVRQCGKCAARVPVIPKIEQLHTAIAKYLVFKKELLSGKEIRFLRKNAGIPAKEFSTLIEVDPAHLSRVENGKTDNLGGAADKLARAVAVAASDGGDVRKLLLQIAGERIRERRTVFGLKKDHWERLAA
jgi:transcriptional regulator with XRE-family HTH domain